MRPYPVFWDFSTRPATVLPVDTTRASVPELADIANYYPDLTVAHQAELVLKGNSDESNEDDDWFYDDE